jgi:isoamylase
MILMGDEVGRTKNGNNNTYCHDNESNWMDWTLLEKNVELHRFFRGIIAFRQAHPVLRGRNHLRNNDYVGSGYADITWHGKNPWQADWSDSSRILAFMLCGKHAKGGEQPDDYIYVALNSHWEGQEIGLPDPPSGLRWHVSANTAVPSPEDIWEVGKEPLLENQLNIWLAGRSMLVLAGR